MITRNYAKFKKTIPKNDLFNKNSEYCKQFDPKGQTNIPGADFGVAERPSAYKHKWEKPDIHVEKVSAYNSQYPGEMPSKDKHITDKALRTSFADRNGNIIGNKYASFENHTTFKKNFAKPEKMTDERKGSSTAALTKTQPVSDLRVPKSYELKTGHEKTTTYTSTFVDHGVKHCPCS